MNNNGADPFSHENLAAAPGPNPFNPEAFRLPPDGGADLVEKLLVDVPIRKPDKQSFVRVHPVYKFEAGFIELKNAGVRGNETYLVAPHVWGTLPNHESRKILYLTVDRFGNPFLWPIRVPGPDGRLDRWTESAAIAAEEAKIRWVNLTANMAGGCYTVNIAKVSNLSDPVWPKEPWEKLLELAFRGGKIIDRADHPVIQQLLGLV